MKKNYCSGHSKKPEEMLLKVAMIPGTKKSIASFLDITDGKMAEVTLLATQHKLLSIIEFLPDATFVVDQNRKVIAWNRAIEDMTGVRKENIIGKGDYAYALPFYGELRPILIDSIFEQEKSISPQYPLHYQKERNTIFAESYTPSIYEGRGAFMWGKASPLLDVNGNIVGAIESIRDITQKHAFENELRTSQERYRALYNAIGGGVLVLGKDFRIIEANKLAKEIHGAPDNEVLSNFFSSQLDFLSEDGFQLRTEELPAARTLKTGESIHGTVIGFKRKGTDKTTWVQTNSVPLFDRDGQVEGVVLTFMDITARKEIETELARRNEFLENILQTANIIILVLDSKGEVIRLNRFGEHLTGYLEEEVIGKNWLDTFIPERERGKFAGKLKEIKDNGYAIGENYILSSDSKELLVSWQGSLLNNTANGVQTFLAVGYDITELRTVEAQLIQAQKMEAVGRLAGGIAHDFNNILTGILGNVSSILTDVSPEDDHFEALKEVKEAALMAADIIEKLLGFSRKSLMQSMVADINDSIYETCKIMERIIDPRIAIKTNLDKNLWLAAADKIQIIQILMNLCLNARDAMMEGGAITITTENVTLSENCFKTHPCYVRPGNFVKISVSDTGCGMLTEIQGKIFEPFFTTKKTGHGTGLGLSMVYGIVKQLKGWIDCYSKIGTGSSFVIHLPQATDGSILVSQNNVSARKAIISGNKTILIVEDKKVVKNFIKRILLKNGYEALTASDGQEAIELYHREWEKIDLVILDMIMPKLSGKDVLILMKEINPSVKVMLTSGYLLSDLEDLQLSKCQFLHKPFTENDLLKKLESLLY